ncbi:MAG: molybdate ABC transporter substrate-binding protein [Oscillospiraceae bacterium]|nr:molybdate ABC transporter substrate-binding protein [Oscillospiraceae bacterium]
MKNWRKHALSLLALTLALALTACGGSGKEKETKSTELTVFAAASMQETLTEIGENYRKDHPNIRLTFNFDSSGTLKTQIQEGADCDIFISAGQKQMDQLDAAASADVNTEGLDFVKTETRFDLLENKVALAVPDGNPASIQSYDGLKAALEAGTVLLAMGNSDVPVGQYTQKIFDFWGLNEEALSGCITYGSNVKEVTTQVSEGAVDCGIIYATDAFSAGLTTVDTATAEMCGQVIYPAAVLSVSRHPDEAEAFLDYVRSPDGAAVLESVGFIPLG